MALTDEQKKEYVKAGGCFCPYCKEENIGGGLIETEVGIALQDVKCNVCKKQWRDIHELTGVAELEN